MAVRRPAFGRHGNKVVAFLCTWEIAALVPGSPLPTISETVDRHPWFGWLLLVLLGHHWYVEVNDAVTAAIGDLITAADVPLPDGVPSPRRFRGSPRRIARRQPAPALAGGTR